MALITTHKITIFSKTFDENAKIVYVPKLVRGYMPTELATQGTNGVNAETNKVRAYISIKLYGNKYRDPIAFERTKKTDTYTLESGGKICLGWYNSIDKAPKVYTIDSVKIYSDGKLAHFEVTAN